MTSEIGFDPGDLEERLTGMSLTLLAEGR